MSCDNNTMEIAKNDGESSSNEVYFQAQTLILSHTLCTANSFALKCAVELGIPELLRGRRDDEPMPLSELARKIPIPPENDGMLRRIMRILVSSGIFCCRQEKASEPSYLPTPASDLLTTGGPDMSACVRALLDQSFMKPWYFLSESIRSEGGVSPFELAYRGRNLWEAAKEHEEKNALLNAFMASYSRSVMKTVLAQCPEVFQGLKSLVDVGGGVGTCAEMIAEAFPEISCSVLDLPHVVAAVPEGGAVSAFSGDMFEHIPPADAVFLKTVLHDWSDEDCVKILRRCREAIPSREEGGKIIIVDIVVNSHSTRKNVTELQLCWDIGLMAAVKGKEREEHEWKKIFNEANFKDYKIFPLLDVNSVIELLP